MEHPMSIRNQTIALGLAGALALGATVSATAGPFPIGTAAVKDAASAKVTDIRWRGRGIGPGLAFGLAAGALAGAAVAARPYGPDYYYAPGPVYADPYAYDTGPTYDTGPAYVAPGYYNYGYRHCYTHQGHRRPRPLS